MSYPELSKADTAQVLNKLRAQHPNKTCFDCGSKNPSWASVTYGIFICIDCSAVHRSLGVHLSFVRSTLLDTSWTWPQLRSMQLGGNGNAHYFFQQHNCNTKDSSQKYNSRVASLYRDKLAQTVANSLKVYGYVLELPSPTSTNNEKQEEETKSESGGDFFHETALSSLSISSASPNHDALFNVGKQSTTKTPREGPNVSVDVLNAKLSDYKPSVIGKKPAASKKGFGAKKGLGAQKVQTDFNKIEQEAILAGQLKESSNSKSTNNLSPEEQEEKLNSIKLAYQEKQRITENKLQSDPNKMAQLERLGMGFANIGSNRPSTISHSAMTDMKVIEQTNPVSSSRSKDSSNDSFMNDLGFSSPSASSYKFKDYIKKSEDDFWNDNGAFDKKPAKKPDIIDTITTIDLDRHHNKSRNKSETSSTTNSNHINKSTTHNEEAQKKFGNAKAISSDQYFENDKSGFDDRSNSRRFEGSRAISSDDYFGRTAIERDSTLGSNFNSTNLYDIKEGVKDSVTKIAGRLSTMATDVVKTINKFDVIS